MSTLQLANLCFDTSGDNRLAYVSSNTLFFELANSKIAAVNSSGLYVNSNITSFVNIFPKSDNYTLTTADHNSVITVSNTVTKTITVPASLPVGYKCAVYMINTGNVVISNAAGVTLNTRNPGYTLSTRYGGASITVIAANSVIVDGATDT
jgi:alpha-glucuronidase